VTAHAGSARRDGERLAAGESPTRRPLTGVAGTAIGLDDALAEAAGAGGLYPGQDPLARVVGTMRRAERPNNAVRRAPPHRWDSIQRGAEREERFWRVRSVAKREHRTPYVRNGGPGICPLIARQAQLRLRLEHRLEKQAAFDDKPAERPRAVPPSQHCDQLSVVQAPEQAHKRRSHFLAEDSWIVDRAYGGPGSRHLGTSSSNKRSTATYASAAAASSVRRKIHLRRRAWAARLRPGLGASDVRSRTRRRFSLSARPCSGESGWPSANPSTSRIAWIISLSSQYCASRPKPLAAASARMRSSSSSAIVVDDTAQTGDAHAGRAALMRPSGDVPPFALAAEVWRSVALRGESL
jgi:hypothetical protein